MPRWRTGCTGDTIAAYWWHVVRWDYVAAAKMGNQLSRRHRCGLMRQVERLNVVKGVTMEHQLPGDTIAARLDGGFFARSPLLQVGTIARREGEMVARF